MTVYIQYPRIKERETSFLLAWELRCFERLVKWYKGDVKSLICALYRDRWSYETKIHHWLLHAILKKYKNIKFKSINMPLKELLKRYLNVDIEMVYKEWEQNKHICVGDVLSWEIQHLNKGALKFFITSCKLRMEENDVSRFMLRNDDREKILDEKLLTQSDEILLILLSSIRYASVCRYMGQANEEDKKRLMDLVKTYFHKENTAFEVLYHLTWEYDIEVEWHWDHIAVDGPPKFKPNEKNPLFHGGILLDYHIRKNPQRVEIFKSMLNGIHAKPSELLAFFRDGTMPSVENIELSDLLL